MLWLGCWDVRRVTKLAGSFLPYSSTAGGVGKYFASNSLMAED